MLQIHVQSILCNKVPVPELGQELSNHVGEDACVAARILHHGLSQTRILLGHIVQVDGDVHLITVGDRRQLGPVLEDLLAVIVGLVEFGQESLDRFYWFGNISVKIVSSVNS